MPVQLETYPWWRKVEPFFVVDGQHVPSFGVRTRSVLFGQSAFVLPLTGLCARPLEGLYGPYESLAELQTPIVELGVADLGYALLGLYGVHAR